MLRCPRPEGCGVPGQGARGQVEARAAGARCADGWRRVRLVLCDPLGGVATRDTNGCKGSSQRVTSAILKRVPLLFKVFLDRPFRVIHTLLRGVVVVPAGQSFTALQFKVRLELAPLLELLPGVTTLGM